MDAARTIQIKSVAGDEGCAGAEPFALMVLGEAMAPEFHEADVIVVEPGGAAADGAYVVAFAGGEWIFRKLESSAGRWRLVALDARHPAIDLTGLDAVRGVVIQRSTPGARSRNKRY